MEENSGKVFSLKDNSVCLSGLSCVKKGKERGTPRRVPLFVFTPRRIVATRRLSGRIGTYPSLGTAEKTIHPEASDRNSKHRQKADRERGKDSETTDSGYTQGKLTQYVR